MAHLRRARHRRGDSFSTTAPRNLIALFFVTVPMAIFRIRRETHRGARKATSQDEETESSASIAMRVDLSKESRRDGLDSSCHEQRISSRVASCRRYSLSVASGRLHERGRPDPGERSGYC